MECPKCGHTQSDTVKCGSCGVYFAKLSQPGPTRPLPAPAQEQRGFSFGALTLVAVVAGGVVYALMHGSHPERQPATVAAQASTPAPAAAVVATAPGAAAPVTGAVDAVEAARRATVFIRTAWGL